MPTEKNPQIEKFLTQIAGVSRQDAAKGGFCTWCKQPVTGFRDSLSQREYQISGLCQNCQDETFGGK